MFRSRDQIVFCLCFLLLIITSGCSMDEGEHQLTVTPLANLTQETSQVFSTDKPPTLTLASAATSTREPTQTSLPTSPAESATPVPQLLPCPDQDPSQEEIGQPIRILYANEDQLWVWDETSQGRTLVNLPTEAVAPHISPNGRYAAFLFTGQSYDSPENPLAEIPLGLFDLQSGRARQVASFPVSETRQKYPESPKIYLQLRWLKDKLESQADQWLLVEVYSEPWGVGCCPPRGDLYLVKAETGETRFILPGEAYNFYSVHPDGTQIAAVNLEGDLYLIDVLPGGSEQFLSLQLPENPWLVFAPVYSPDGAHVALQAEGDLAVIDTITGSTQELELENPCQDCYWGPRLPILWHPDGKRFFTTTTLNDYFDQRAETTLVQVNLGSELEMETLAVIPANPFTLNFSPDFRYLSYWNQPDWDSPGASEEKMNWVSLYLMDLESQDTRLYEEQFGLRISRWNPDNQHFLYTFSSTGGPNLDRRKFSLGNICQSPEMLPVPQGSIIGETLWMDTDRLLFWTQPADGIPVCYDSGLYLYQIDAGSQLVHIDDILIDQSEPYGTLKQIAVLQQ